MAIIKCKMCGGDLILHPNSTTAECEYCGTMQTVPSADNEKKLTLFARANRLRMACEFDKATGVYEAIVADFPEEAEAYWGLVLCRYGIEYVDDPSSGKKVPTCHRSSFDSVMDDDNFEQALENADVLARKVYRDEAQQIEEIRKGIVEVSSREDPYDIFICYKETDINGNRTLDSVLAQDIYTALTEKGYRVFFSRITLEDKLGQEYEPYIFAALNSAKIMLAVGTDYEHYNAVWVKNEWSRFLHLISSGQKKALIPCYKNIDAYDMPKEFAKLQAQDLGKVGAIQDLLRGVDKILSKPAATTVNMQSTAQEAVRTIEQEKTRKQVENAVSLGVMALDAGDNEKAIVNFEAALKLDSECIGAYLGLTRIITDSGKVAPYVKKLTSISTDRVLDYIRLNRGVIGNLQNSNNLLTIAVKTIRSEALIEGILDIGIDGNAKDALAHYLDKFENIAIIKKMIDCGADVNATIWWRNSYKKEYDSYYKTYYESYNKEYHSVLSTAVGCQRKEIIELLVNAGANVNHSIVRYSYYHKIGEKSDGYKSKTYSMLHEAIIKKRHDAAEALLKSGTDPEIGSTVPMQFYYEYEDPDRGKTTTSIPTNKEIISTNLSAAIKIKDVKMLKLLLTYGANPNRMYENPVWRERASYKKIQIASSKRTSLVDAILSSSDVLIVKTLLEHGADPKAMYTYEENVGPDRTNNRTVIPVLGIAVEKRNKEAVQALIAAGATFSQDVLYDKKGAYSSRLGTCPRIIDRFPLSELVFGDKVVAEMGDMIKANGWKGSKSGWFSKAHDCYYAW